MSQIISLTVHGRSYQVTCDEGQESHLMKLAQHIDRKMAELETSVGHLALRPGAAPRRAGALPPPARGRPRSRRPGRWMPAPSASRLLPPGSRVLR